MSSRPPTVLLVVRQIWKGPATLLVTSCVTWLKCADSQLTCSEGSVTIASIVFLITAEGIRGDNKVICFENFSCTEVCSPPGWTLLQEKDYTLK